MVARVFIVALTLLAGVLLGLNHVWRNSPASQITPLRTGDDAATVAFQTEVEHAYETKGFDYMEAMAEALRKDESRVAGGNTRLFELYNVLADIRCGCRDGTRMYHSFEDRRTRLEGWLRKYPDSTTATLAMAVLWNYRALQIAVGRDDIQRTRVERREAFLDAKRVAASYIGRLKISDDPYVAFFTLLLQRDDNQDRDRNRKEARRLFEQSTAAWPRHYQIYFLYFQSMDPALNWNPDRQGQLRLLSDLAAAKSDPDQQVGLAYIVGARYHGGRFDGSGVSWDDVKHAYAVRRDIYDWRNRDLNVICYLAIQAGDWEAAKAYMQEIDGHWDDLVWYSQNDFVWNELVVSLH